jgi:VWFA-related protein
MTRSLPGAALTTALGLTVVAGSPRQDTPQRPMFRTAADVVTVDVSVRRRNTPIIGLTVADFEVRDNGVVQSVELRPSDAMPIDVSVVLNMGIADSGWLRSSLASDLASIARRVRPIDRLRVIAYHTEVREVLQMQRPGDWASGRLPAATLEQAASELARAATRGFGRHALFDALLLAMARPADPGRRHLVIPFCFSVDNASVLSDGSVLEAVAARTGALMHVALWGGRTEGLPTASLQTTYTRAALEAAAKTTGGQVHFVGSGGVGAFKDIFDDLRMSYVLQYTVQGVPPGGWHEISVRLPKHPDYTVRARKGYVGR